MLASQLAAKGWTVDEVVAYKTVSVSASPEAVGEVRAADAVVFTSSSTVDNLVASLGVDALPPVIVSIGPITSATLRSHGLTPTAEADPHTVAGLVDALSREFAQG